MGEGYSSTSEFVTTTRDIKEELAIVDCICPKSEVLSQLRSIAA